jgi:hypothetical protein
MEDVQSKNTIARLPLVLRLAAPFVLIGSAIFAARIVREQTVWTWQRGPQMVGFSLAHGAGAILFLTPLLLLIWLVVAPGFTIRDKIKKKRFGPARFALLGLAILLLILPSLPDGFWQRLLVSRMAKSPRAGDLFFYAANRGDLGTVRGLVQHGVPVKAVDRAQFRTAAHGAARGGQTEVLRYLASSGADLNALDRAGDSPLELAVSANQQEAAAFLAGCGAKKIAGTPAQRDKAIHDQVSDDVEELNRAEGITIPSGASAPK